LNDDTIYTVSKLGPRKTSKSETVRKAPHFFGVQGRLQEITLSGYIHERRQNFEKCSAYRRPRNLV